MHVQVDLFDIVKLGCMLGLILLLFDKQVVSAYGKHTCSIICIEVVPMRFQGATIHNKKAISKSQSKGSRRIKLAVESLESIIAMAYINVTNTSPTGPGSLAAAIGQANSNQNLDTIIFSSGLASDSDGYIRIDASSLPQITSPVMIDGIDLGNGSLRNVWNVVLDGKGKDVLQFNKYIGADPSDSIVKNISIVNGAVAIQVNGYSNSSRVSNITIKQNCIGTTFVDGKQLSNGAGLSLNRIDGGLVAGNTIAFNKGVGVTIADCNNVVVSNNTIKNNGEGIVTSGVVTAPSILTENRIFNNSGKGIVVPGTVNPVITSATLAQGSGRFSLDKVLRITAMLTNAAPNTDYSFSFFYTPRANALNPINAQGEYSFGNAYNEVVTTDGTGSGIVNTTIVVDQSFLAYLNINSMRIGDFVTATVTCDAKGTSEFSNSVPLGVFQQADLSVQLSAASLDPNPKFVVGDIVNYQMVVNNSGPNEALNVKLNGFFDTSLILLNYTTTQGVVTLDSLGNFSGILGTVAPLNSVVINLQFKATKTSVDLPSSEICNYVILSSSTFDPYPVDNKAESCITVLPVPTSDLQLDGTFDPSVIPMGDLSTYTLTINNNGPEIARGNTLITDLGNGASFVTATNDHGTLTYNPNTNKVYFTLGQIEVAGKATVTLTLRGQKPGITTLTSTVSTTSQEISPSTNTIASDLIIVDVPGQMQFPRSTFNSLEGNLVYIPVTRAQGTYGDAQVLFNTQDGTAIAGVDYVPVTNYVVDFPNGDNSTKYVPVQLLTSPEWFAAKSLSLVLSDAAGANLGSPSTATLNIKSTQPVPVGSISGFTATPNPVLETDGFVTYTVIRSGGANKALAVNYATADGTALAGVNYSTTTGTLNWADGEMGSKTFKVPILQDNVYTANNLNFNVNLTAGNADTTFTTATTQTESIVNTTETSTVSFNPTAYSVDMNAGTVTLTVTRAAVPITGITGQVPSLSVSYATSNGTAISGTDYSATSGTVAWAAGDVSPKTITVPILVVSAPSLDKQFTVGLSNPVLAANGSIVNGTGTVTITGHNVDTQGPVVSMVQLSGTATSFSEVYLTFNEPLNAASASVASNYVVLDSSNNQIPVTGVQYLSASNAVVVSLPAGATRANALYSVVVNGTSPSGVTDLFGNFLNGSGTNGTNFINSVGRGTALTYIDNMNNLVNVGLRGGFMDLVRYANGGGRSLSTYNTTASSVLSGTVKLRSASSTGYTRFDYLSGVGQPFNFQVTATTPPFLWAKIYGTNPPLPGGVAAAKLAANKLRRGR